MRENLVLIVNPYAGVNQHNRNEPVYGKWRNIEEYVLETLGKKFEIDKNVTKFGKHSFKRIIEDKLTEYRDDKDTIYIFVGGDDTIDNYVTSTIKTANSLSIDPDSLKVGCILSGEGVALQYALGLGDLRQSLELIVNHKENHAHIDMIDFNGDRYGFYAGHGIFGEAVGEREKTRTSGVKGYIIPAFKAYSSNLIRRIISKSKKIIRYKNNSAEETIEDYGMGVLISKIRCIGGGIELVPQAKLNDGKLHIISYDSWFSTRTWAAEEIRIETDGHVHYGGDYQGKKDISFSVIRGAVDIILNKPELERTGALIPTN